MSTLNHIRNYIAFLSREYSLNVSIHHIHSPSMQIGRYTEFNLHTNPYCMYLKTNAEVWNSCIDSQKLVSDKCRACGDFVGMCRYGVLEYVYSLADEFGEGSFICVSGYRPAEDSELYPKALHKITKLCDEYSLNRMAVMDMYTRSLRTELPDRRLIDSLIEPLRDMLYLDHIELERAEAEKAKSQTSGNSQDALFYTVCNLIRRRHNSKLNLNDICRRTHYSPSYISHMFKTRSGMTINQYINELRISEAKALLNSTNMSIQDIAMAIGFSDSNYFSNVFRGKVGSSPREWRNADKNNEKNSII